MNYNDAVINPQVLTVKLSAGVQSAQPVVLVVTIVFQGFLVLLEQIRWALNPGWCGC